GRDGVFTSASPRCRNSGDVDLLHRHHGLESTLGLIATNRKCIGEGARGDLPGEAPTVLAPTALAFLAAIADDRVPVAVCLFLILRRDLEGKRLAVPERGAAVETETGNAQNGADGRTMEPAPPVPLFATRIGGALQGNLRQQYMVSPDGQRFLMNTITEEAAVADDHTPAELESQALNERSAKSQVSVS